MGLRKWFQRLLVVQPMCAGREQFRAEMDSQPPVSTKGILVVVVVDQNYSQKVIRCSNRMQSRNAGVSERQKVAGWRTNRPKTKMQNLSKTLLDQYSSGRSMVVTERSHSVMIQNAVPLSV